MADEKEKVLLYDAIDSSILKSIPNPSKEPYEIKVKVPEFTFLGVNEQPDFGVLYITMYPTKKIIELKSLKQYAYQLRNIVVSYERLINVVYDHLMEVYALHQRPYHEEHQTYNKVNGDDATLRSFDSLASLR